MLLWWYLFCFFFFFLCDVVLCRYITYCDVICFVGLLLVVRLYFVSCDYMCVWCVLWRVGVSVCCSSLCYVVLCYGIMCDLFFVFFALFCVGEYHVVVVGVGVLCVIVCCGVCVYDVYVF